MFNKANTLALVFESRVTIGFPSVFLALILDGGSIRQWGNGHAAGTKTHRNRWRSHRIRGGIDY